MLAKALLRLDATFERTSKTALFAIALITAILLGFAAYFAGSDLLILYLGPIFLASWYAGWRFGLAVAIYAAVAAFVMETIQMGQAEFNPKLVVTLVIRLAAYLIIARTMARLSQARRERSELTNFIVHDLRSPLASSIAGLMTLQQTSSKLPAEEQEMVNLALIGNERALSLVNSILDVAKLESGAMEVERREVDLNEFVDECLQQVELWARGDGILLAKEIGVEKAQLDPTLTSRVLVNLLGNALKYSPEGGAVTVRAVSSHGAVRFSVVDQGPGIPAEYVDVIFEPFSQVKGTQGGSGLGLTFCRLAVQAQGGKIWVESHHGQGAIIHFTLPQHA